VADTSLTFDIVARDRASSTFDKIKGKAALLGAAAAALAIKFGKDSVSAFVEAEQSQNRLQAAFAKFPGLADTNIGRLNSLNASLAKKTKFDDDATASGQAVLAQFKLTGSQIEQLTPLLQDYAAKTGKDLPTAAGDLGKAMLGQGRALKAIGLDFQDTGTASGNFAEIMGGLRTQVGGFAEKEGQTAAGKAEILRNQFGELQESVGSKLVPALTALAEQLLAVIGFVQSNSAVIGPLVGILGAVAAGVWLVNTASKAWAATQAAVNLVLTANPIGLVIVAIAALVAGVILAYQHSETFRNIVQAAFNGVKAAGDAMWSALRAVFGALGDAFDAARSGVAAVRDAISSAFRASATLVLDMVDNMLGGLSTLLGFMGRLPGPLGAPFRAAGDAIDTARGKVAELRNSLDGLPGNTTVNVGVKGGQAAIAEVAQLRWELQHIPPSVTTQVLVKSGQIPRNNAGGTRDFEGGLTWVGERGPELLALPQHSQIFTASESRQMMGSPGGVGTPAGGIVIQNLTLPGVTDPASFVQALQDYSRRNGPIRGVSFA
jgi:hypothetical protein